MPATWARKISSAPASTTSPRSAPRAPNDLDPLRASAFDVRPSDPLRIGLSTNGPEQAKRALAAGADYLGVGPVYAYRNQTPGQARHP